MPNRALQFTRALTIAITLGGASATVPIGSAQAAPAAINASDVLASAESLLGVPYVWGGASPDGFDCSGFLSWIWQIPPPPPLPPGALRSPRPSHRPALPRAAVPEAQATLTGRVTNEHNGAPISGRVFYWKSDDRRNVGSVETDAAGHFAIPELEG